MSVERPLLRVRSADGARIAIFGLEPPRPDGPFAEDAFRGPDAARGQAVALLLVHGSGSDHSTWRVTGPVLAGRHRVYALDRRGRGASGEGPAWSAGLEVDDLVAAAGTVGAHADMPVVVVGHSFGGRLSLAAAAHGAPLAGVVAIEAAPAAPGDPSRAGHEDLLAGLRADVERGDDDAVLARFLREVAGLPPAELASFRATPLWSQRVPTAPTVVRELDAALHDPSLAAEALIGGSMPVLQVVGTASPRWFMEAAATLDARLPAGTLHRIDGAGHGLHHTHPDELAAAVEAWLAG
jgi:pimeloyl-ACP methyl ester carboxylesterase